MSVLLRVLSGKTAEECRDLAFRWMRRSQRSKTLVTCEAWSHAWDVADAMYAAMDDDKRMQRLATRERKAPIISMVTREEAVQRAYDIGKRDGAREEREAVVKYLEDYAGRISQFLWPREVMLMHELVDDIRAGKHRAGG